MVKQNLKSQVTIPPNHPNPPEPHEISTAHLLARHFQCEIEFLTPSDQYKVKTPDFKMLGVEWELKCPLGSSKSTIYHQIRLASKQSNYIIIDLARSKLDISKATRQIQFELKKRNAIKRIILITKNKKIVEFSR